MDYTGISTIRSIIPKLPLFFTLCIISEISREYLAIVVCGGGGAKCTKGEPARRSFIFQWDRGSWHEGA